MIHMDSKVIGVGTVLLVVLIFMAVVIYPQRTNPEHDELSEGFRPRTALEDEGRSLYIALGCQYCHSQYIRTVDWGLGAERIAQAGDYARDTAPQLGSIRNGPDLSQEGGEHSDDWHVAHFHNPRWTRPESIMPPFPYLQDERREALIAFVQSLGGTAADGRVERQWRWRKPAIAAYEQGADANIKWLHKHVPAP
ncbi:cbb3-type cytochrome c oxidase subunit II, partial [Planctomycetota bacterium]